MKQQITIVDPIFGSIDAKVIINSNYDNTLQVGNKRCHFDDIDVFTDRNFHIIMYGDVRNIRAELIIDAKITFFKAWHCADKHEELTFTKVIRE